MKLPDRIAPPEATWVCHCCGKNGPDRYNIGDESCMLNAILCYKEKLGDEWVAYNEH